ncbi:uncharacterized protein METZ01_LOCUS385439 [marine metagenome]|uniref:Uncharacterized protein n=1 Tax=marine metagenome TaxID=408172 RepID=A0A382UFH0_9ZZZZ
MILIFSLPGKGFNDDGPAPEPFSPRLNRRSNRTRIIACLATKIIAGRF